MFYRKIVRPLLFLFDPEFIHHFTFSLFGAFPFLGWIIRTVTRGNQKYTQPVNAFGLTFRHPVGLAGGLDKNAKALSFMRNLGFAFMEVGTVTPIAQVGNPKPRLFRLKRNFALINRMGFNNHGVERIRRRLLNRPSGLLIGGNIGKNTSTSNEDAWRDYVKSFERLYDCVDFFIVNVSCPNIKDLSKLQNRDQLKEILDRLLEQRSSRQVRRPILLKISPDLSFIQLDEVIEVVRETGIDGLVATNTSIRRDNLSYSQSELDRIGTGGLSGKPLSKRSTEIIRYLTQNLGDEFPIIASGGIMSPEDALEKINAGAKLVQFYTGFVYEGPGILFKTLESIRLSKKSC